MRLIRKTLLPLFLLTLFTAYQVSITMFTHVHYINGTVIVHSHPSGDKHHTHTKAALMVVVRLGVFHSPEAKTAECELLVKPPLLWILETEKTTPLAVAAYFNFISLRAPPMC